ncbi:MAG: NAD(P)/FAD-dependent oxidoreductase [Acidobacteriota bacterium]
MIVIVGAGAAGLMAAIFAAGGPRPVLVIERTSDGGRKILISGGGRCNVLPSEPALERFVSDSPRHILRGWLRSWPLARQRAFFEEDLGVPLALETATGKLFPRSNRAREVRDTLVSHARRLGVSFRFDTAMTNLEPAGDAWTVHTPSGPITASAVVLATGGLSVPATGSDGVGLRVAATLGHLVHQTYPALTPLTEDPPRHSDLSGVSLTVQLNAHAGRQRSEATGGFLFTHRGYSGPAVLDVSHVAVRSRTGGDPAIVRVNWGALSEADWQAALSPRAGRVASIVARHIPQRLAVRLMEETRVPADRLASGLRRTERLAMIQALTRYQLPWTGDEGYRKAEVTGGGVALDAVHSGTLESLRCPGLFLCGELLDAFGPIGGHNFAWAWATGRLAGLGAVLRTGP